MPFALVLYAWLQLQERDRIRALRDRERDVHRATLTAMAFNKPELLDDERSTIIADMRRSPVAHVRASVNAELRAAGEALAARIEAGGVLQDGA